MRWRWCMVAAVWVAGSAWGQVTMIESDRSQPPRRVELAVSPAAAPEPALRWRLMPARSEQKAGNAAVLYYSAVNLLPKEDEPAQKVSDWLGVEVSELPLDEVEQVLSRYRSALRQVELGAQRDHARWERPLEEGMEMLLPGLGDFRTLAKALALRARLEMARGDYDAAVRTLATGMQFAGHIAQGPTLIENLVGIAIHGVMLEQVEELIQLEGSPNLYWALQVLPKPLVNVRAALEYEACWVTAKWPDLGRMEREILSAAEVRQIAREVVRELQVATGAADAQEAQVGAWGLTLLLYPHSKVMLLERGWSRERVEAMPTGQVVALAQLRDYERVRDDLSKWFYVPYAQARPGLEQAQQELHRIRRAGFSGMRSGGQLASILLPALGRVYFLQAKMDRQVAMLEAVEMVRMYAAGHGGELPARLEDVAETVVPEDPLWGRPVTYRVEGGVAVIESLAPEYAAADDGLIYTVVIEGGKERR